MVKLYRPPRFFFMEMNGSLSSLILLARRSEPFGGGRMRVEGEQMLCGSNWKTSFIYFPGFDEYLGRMWQDELKEHPLKEKEREE